MPILNLDELKKSILFSLYKIGGFERLKDLDRIRIYTTEVLLCLRRAFLSIKLNTVSQLNQPMYMGKVIHIAMEELLKHALPELGFKKVDTEAVLEVPIEGTKYVLVAKPDVVAEDSTGDEVVIEIKTFRRSLPTLNKILFHYLQLQTYLNILNIGKGYILYVDRENVLKIYLLEFKKVDLWDWFRERLNHLINCLEENKLPDKNYRLFDWECLSCNFKPICNRVTRWVIR